MSKAGKPPVTTLPADTQEHDVKSFPGMLKAFEGEIERALPEHMKGGKMARIALTAFRRTPKLAQCDPRSVFAAVIQAAQLGLEPDTLGRAYLIPYAVNKKVGNTWTKTFECQFIPGWKGLVDLMNRSGLGTAYTGVIFKDQKYTFKDGSVRSLVVHNESALSKPSDITHAFAIGHIKGGMFPIIELWRIDKIIAHRDRYNKVGEKHYSYENLEMYARKVPLLQVLKYMPMSSELAKTVMLDDAAAMGRQGLDINSAIDGSWVQVPDDDDAETDQTPKNQGQGATQKQPAEDVDKTTGEISGTSIANTAKAGQSVAVTEPKKPAAEPAQQSPAADPPTPTKPAAKKDAVQAAVEDPLFGDD